MKKLARHISMLLFALSLTVFIASCSSDDKDDTPQIEGEYVGNYVSLASPSGAEVTLIVTKEGNSTYLLKFTSKNAIQLPASYTVTLSDTGVSGIWQSVATSPYVQFMTNDNAVSIANNTGAYYTFQGRK